MDDDEDKRAIAGCGLAVALCVALLTGLVYTIVAVIEAVR